MLGLDNGWTGFGHAEWGYNSGANGDNNLRPTTVYAGVEHDKYGKIAAGTKRGLLLWRSMVHRLRSLSSVLAAQVFTTFLTEIVCASGTGQGRKLHSTVTQSTTK